MYMFYLKKEKNSFKLYIILAGKIYHDYPFSLGSPSLHKKKEGTVNYMLLVNYEIEVTL